MPAHEATSKHQFGKYMVTKENWNLDSPTQWTSYRLYQQGAHPHDPASMVGTAEIMHTHPDAYNLYPGPLGETTQASGPPGDPMSRKMLHKGYNEKWATRNAITHDENTRLAEAGRPTEVVGQIPMFRHSSEPESVTLEGLIMSKQARHMSPMLLGVAANEAKNRGFNLKTPDSLSAHSQRMVSKLKDVGAVQEGHSFKPNNLDWVQPTELPTPGGLEGFESTLAHQRAQPSGLQEHPITAEEAHAGSRTARQVLGRKRRSEAFEQGSLF